MDDILQDDLPQLIGKSIITTEIVEEEAERLAAKPLRAFQWRSRRPAEALEIATGTVQVDLAMGANEIDSGSATVNAASRSRVSATTSETGTVVAGVAAVTVGVVVTVLVVVVLVVIVGACVVTGAIVASTASVSAGGTVEDTAVAGVSAVSDPLHAAASDRAKTTRTSLRITRRLEPQ